MSTRVVTEPVAHDQPRRRASARLTRLMPTLTCARPPGDHAPVLPPPGPDDVARAFLERAAELDAAHAGRRGPLRPYLWRWAAALLRPPAPPQAEPLPPVHPGELAATFIGHATVLLRYADTRILTDPALGRFAGPVARVRAAAAASLDLAAIDLCLISHAHFDHLDPPSLRRLPRGATVVVPPRCAELCSRLGFARVIELAVGEAIAHRGVEVIAVPARHYGGRSLLDPRRRGGCGYIIRGNGPTAYFAGDTGYFSGFLDVGQRYAPDLALLPIGAYRPLAFRRYHMSPLDAVYAFADLGARVLLPVHHGAFPLSYEPLDEPAAWMRELAREHGLTDRVALLEPGQTRVLR
ncbi:MAG TPA: MBL fold metallo-hydrolase [Polyangia bacterium]